MPLRVVDLNGCQWRLGQAPQDVLPERARWGELEQISEWLPATVPGHVQADLVDSGRLPDPHLEPDSEALRLAGTQSWWLTREFPMELQAGDQARLVLRGLDYRGDVFLNGHHLGHHEGMFAPLDYDVTSLLQPENRLAVRLLGSRWLPRNRSTPWEKLLSRIEARWSGLQTPYPDRRDTLKCQMQFGWDFAPPLLTMGLWDDAYVGISRGAVIREVRTEFRPSRAPERPNLAVAVRLAGRRERAVRLVARLKGETFEAEPRVIERPIGPGRAEEPISLALSVPEPRLWWPWDHGDPNLYRLAVEAWDGDGLLDTLTQTIGLRQIEIRDYGIQVNGRPVFARGANWVPASLFPGRVTHQGYTRLLKMARDANMNMLRVWGGGLREKESFYAECDRLGIQVWQEFPFACSFLTRFPRSREYLDLVKAEAAGIVRTIRHHPSVVLWSGGNEFSARRNARLIATLREAVTQEDPGRPFLPVSPHDGDRHNWGVWHGFASPATYRRDRARFASEFGLQAPPSANELLRFLPPGQAWPPGAAWTLHGAGLRKLWRYARPFLPAPAREARLPAWGLTTLESFVHASQQSQLRGLGIAVEHFRRRKAEGCGGLLLWQLNEPWPAISWAVIAFSGAGKPAYHSLERLLGPVMVSVDYAQRRYAGGDLFPAQLWVINDTNSALPGCELRAALYDDSGRAAERLGLPVDLEPSSAAPVARTEWRLPPGQRWLVRCSLVQGTRVLADNQYELGVEDDIAPTSGQRLRWWLASLVVRL